MKPNYLSYLYQWWRLGLLVPIATLNIWILSKGIATLQPLATVFILAILLAFILNYPVNVLHQWGMKRGLSIVLVYVLMLSGLAGFSVTLLPVLSEEFVNFTDSLPHLFESSVQELQALQDWAANWGLPIHLNYWISRLINTFSETDKLEFLGDRLLAIVFEVVESISQFALALVLAFYLLLDGERLWNSFLQNFPSQRTVQVRQALQQNFQRFFIGQVAIASLMGSSMTVVLLLLKVPFALVFGLSTWVLALFPFGDFLSIVVVSLLVTIQNPGLGVKVLVLAIAMDQIIDQVITPRLLGKFVGLRPFWVLSALLIGAKLGGPLGLILAVPLASFIKSALSGFADISIAEESALDALDMRCVGEVAPVSRAGSEVQSPSA